MKCVAGVHEVSSAVPASEFRERYLEGTNVMKEDVYEKDRWIYWLGFFAAHGRLRLVIEDRGACETTITSTRTTMPVHYDAIHVFAEKTRLVLADDKLSALFEKGGHMTAQLYVDPARGEHMLRAEVKAAKGSPIPPISNASPTLPRQNDEMNDRFSVA